MIYVCMSTSICICTPPTLLSGVAFVSQSLEIPGLNEMCIAHVISFAPSCAAYIYICLWVSIYIYIDTYLYSNDKGKLCKRQQYLLLLRRSAGRHLRGRLTRQLTRMGARPLENTAMWCTLMMELWMMLCAYIRSHFGAKWIHFFL